MKLLPIIGTAVVLAASSVCADQDPAATLGILLRTLSTIENPAAQANILRGMNASLKGKEGIAAPDGWDGLYGRLSQSPSDEVRREALALAAAFGSSGALDHLRATAADETANAADRRSALASLLAAKDAGTLPLLLELIRQPGPLRSEALRGLAGYDDPAIATAILDHHAGLDAADKRDALNTLVARGPWAASLLAAIDAGQLDRSEISAPLATQLRSLREPAIDAWVETNWGAVRVSSDDKKQEIEQHRKFLGVEAILAADAYKGREIFLQRCAACHVMHGEGYQIGPELPGSYEDLDYLLENLLDPNAVIGRDYQQTVVRTKDGRTVSGVITSDEASAVTLKTLAERIVIRRGDIEAIETLEVSLMPEGLLTGLDEDDIRDLFLYLRQGKPLPARP